MTDEPEPKQSLMRKLVAVMGEVERLEKKARNQQQKYDYVSESQVKDALRPLFVKHGLVFVPHNTGHSIVDKPTRSGGSMAHMTATYAFKIIDADSGEVLEFDGIGQGMDTGDKAAYKALTGGTRHALMTMFLIPTGDDPEGDQAAQAQSQHVSQPVSQGKPQAQSQPEQVQDITEDTASKVKRELIRVGKAKNPAQASKLLKEYEVTTEAKGRKWIQQLSELGDGAKAGE